MVGVEGNLLGAGVWFFQAQHLDFEIEPGQDVVTKIAATWSVNGQIHAGKVVTTLRTVTADGSSEAASLDNAASTATGYVAVVQAANVNLDGGDGLQVDVRHSVDNVTFADLTAFTEITADRGAQIKSASSGTVNRYLAAEWTFTGSPGAGATADVFVALKRGQ